MHLLAWPLVRSHGYTSSRCISGFFDPFNNRSHTLHSLTNILATNHTCCGVFSNPERGHQDEQSGALAFTKDEYCNRSIFPYCSLAKGSFYLQGDYYGQKSVAHHDPW